MSDYISLRRTLIWQLEHDSAAHESGRYEDVGRHFDSVAESFDLVKYYVPRGSPESDRRAAATRLLARRLVADLAANRDASDPNLKRYFPRGELKR